MSLPNFQTYLPSRVRETITDHVLAQLKASRLNWYADPMYDIKDLWKDLRENNDVTPWLNQVADDCFKVASHLYNQQCPKEHAIRVSGMGSHPPYRMVDGQKKKALR